MCGAYPALGMTPGSDQLWFFLKASDERPLKSGIKFYSEYKKLVGTVLVNM